MRNINTARSHIRHPVLMWLLVTLGATLVMSLSFAHESIRVRSSQAAELRYVVQTKKTATFYVGKSGDINIVLQNQDGARVLAGKDRRLTITASTLDKLDSAKTVLPAKPKTGRRSKSGYDDNKLVLARGQKAAQITIEHEYNEYDKDVHLVSYQSGRIYIFAEGDGIATGSTYVVVRDSRERIAALGPHSPLNEPMLLPVMWQGPGGARLRLEISPVNREPENDKGEKVARFKVELHSATGEGFADALEEIKVVLKVKDGYARFDPDILKIPKDDVITAETTVLRSRPGGVITMLAAARNAERLKIDPHEGKFEFSEGPHTTHLEVRPTRQSAVANGLDEVELEVEAVGGDGRNMHPEDEGMDERIITFRLLGDASGVKFENGNNRVRIAKGGEPSGKIKLSSTRPVSNVQVVAESWNGLSKPITSEGKMIPIQFSFPWFQLLCATIGGGVFPLLWRQNKTTVATGLLLGAVFFGLALFGAIASSPQNLGTVSVYLASLPTEAPFASFILGLIGSVLIGAVFKRQLGTGGDRLPPETRSIDATQAQAQSNPVSDSNDQEKSARPLTHQDDFVD